MFVVTVKFFVAKGHFDLFIPAMKQQARDSLEKESACQYFDVCVDQVSDDGDTRCIFLYEVYDSKADFDVHLTTEHFKNFSSKIASWVVKKEVDTFQRITAD